MARGDIRQRISLDGGEEVRRQLADLGKAGEKAFADLNAATSGASTNLLQVSNVARDLQAIFGRFGGLGAVGAGAFSGIASAAAGMTSALGAIVAGAVAATAALGALAVSGAKAASEIKEGATRVGVSADDYTKLKFAFEQSGSSAESFEKAMAVILDAAGEAGKAALAASAEIAKANDAIAQSSVAAADAAQKRATDLAQSILDVARGLATDLRNIDIQEGRAIRGLTEGPLTERAAIERRFREQREDAQRAAAERALEIQRKAAEKEREERAKLLKEQQKQLDDFNKAMEDAARKAASPFEKLNVALIDAAGNARDPANAFRDIAEAVGKIEDPARRAATVIELFGRRVGTQMVEALSEGRIGLEALGKEAERLGLVFTDAELKIGKRFSDTLQKLGNTISATSAKVGLAFAGMFDGVADALAAAIGRAQGPIIEFAKSIAAAIKPIFDDITNLITGDIDKINSQFIVVLIPTVQLFGSGLQVLGQIVGAVFAVLVASFQQIAGLINEVFGTKVVAGDIPAFIGATYLAVAAVGALRAAFVAVGLTPFGLLVTALAAVAAGLVLLLGPTQQIGELIGQVFGVNAKASFDAFVASFQAMADQFVTNLSAFLESIGNLWNAAWTAMAEWVQAKINDIVGFLQPLTSAIQSVLGFLDALISKASAAASAVANAVAGSGGPTQFHARGGFIRGPGTATSDSVPIWGSVGEAITRTAAVNYYGRDVFAGLNNMAFPRDALRAALGGMRGFALGGLVDVMNTSLLPRRRRFAAGGLVAAGAGVGGRAAFNIILDGRKFEATAPQDVAEALAKHARARRVRSGGRAPSWVG